MAQKDKQPALRPPQQPQHAVLAAHSEQWSGPMPHPDSLRAYQSMVPDAPERILRVFEQDSDHVRHVQMTALNGQINRDRRGQWMAFGVIVGGMSLTAWSMWLGNSPGALLSGLATFVWAAIQFYRKGSQPQQNQNGNGK